MTVAEKVKSWLDEIGAEMYALSIPARAQGGGEMSYGYKCATCSRKDTEICEQCLGDQHAPIAKPATVQSAEELVDEIRGCDYMEGDWDILKNDSIKLIESRDAAQRQAGRKEAAERVCKHCGLSSSPCLEKCEIVKVILGEESTR